MIVFITSGSLVSNHHLIYTNKRSIHQSKDHLIYLQTLESPFYDYLLYLWTLERHIVYMLSLIT